MTALLRSLHASAAGWLLAACGAAFAAAPAVTDALLAPLESAYLKAVTPGADAAWHRDLFRTVLERVERSHAQEVDLSRFTAAALNTLEPLAPQSGEPGQVFAKAINAALATLDPYSRYLDAEAAKHHRSTMTGSFGGLGLQVEMVDGLVRVVAPIPNTPAARAGLQSGDFIVGFDDRPTQGLTLAEAVSFMRGEPGTWISLMIRRAGQDDTFTVSLVREVIRRDPVRWSMEGDVLVLRLAIFTGGAAGALDKAIVEATAAATPRAIVLDLRGNGGGLFRQAVMTADAFLSAGEIVSIEGRTNFRRRNWAANTGERLEGVPMVDVLLARKHAPQLAVQLGNRVRRNAGRPDDSLEGSRLESGQPLLGDRRCIRRGCDARAAGNPDRLEPAAGYRGPGREHAVEQHVRLSADDAGDRVRAALVGDVGPVHAGALREFDAGEVRCAADA